MKMFALVPILVVFGMLSLSVSIWLSRCSICYRRRRRSSQNESTSIKNGEEIQNGADGGSVSGGDENNGIIVNNAITTTGGGGSHKYTRKIVNYCLCAKSRWRRQQQKKKQLEYLPHFLVDICQVDTKVPFGSISSNLSSLPQILVEKINDPSSEKNLNKNICENEGNSSVLNGASLCGKDNLAFEADVVTGNGNETQPESLPVCQYTCCCDARQNASTYSSSEKMTRLSSSSSSSSSASSSPVLFTTAQSQNNNHNHNLHNNHRNNSVSNNGSSQGSIGHSHHSHQFHHHRRQQPHADSVEENGDPAVVERRYGGPPAASAALVIQRAYRRYSMVKEFQRIKTERRLSRRINNNAAVPAGSNACSICIDLHEPHSHPTSADGDGLDDEFIEDASITSSCNELPPMPISDCAEVTEVDVEVDHAILSHSSSGSSSHHHQHHQVTSSSLDENDPGASSTVTHAHHQHQQQHQQHYTGQFSSSSRLQQQSLPSAQQQQHQQLHYSSSATVSSSRITHHQQQSRHFSQTQVPHPHHAHQHHNIPAKILHHQSSTSNAPNLVVTPSSSLQVSPNISSSSVSSSQSSPAAAAAATAPQEKQQHRSPKLSDGDAEILRKRLYRVGLNLFNKKPEVGVAYLVKKKFLEGSPPHVARFLISRKGLSKQMIGEYLANLQSPFSMSCLEHFASEIDLASMPVDVALRRFQTFLRMPGEAQKIERIMESFSRRYAACNPQLVSQFRNGADTVFVLAFAIVMLNTDLHTPHLKQDRRMKLEDFIKNLRGIDDNGDIDREILVGIYERIKQSEFKTGSDHVTQVQKVMQTILNGKKPNLALPHRRLVCYCRLYEVSDVNKREKAGSHQREVFLFNDLLVLTKIFHKKRNSVTYSFRQSYPLSGITLVMFTNQYFDHGLTLKRGDTVLLNLNARNEHDRAKFTEDLREAIAESDEMTRIETISKENRDRDSGVDVGKIKRFSNSLLDISDQCKPLRRGSCGSLDSGMSVSFHSDEVHQQQQQHQPSPLGTSNGNGGSNQTSQSHSQHAHHPQQSHHLYQQIHHHQQTSSSNCSASSSQLSHS